MLLIDEAHHLSADLLEELRLLGNLEAGAGKAVHRTMSALGRVFCNTPAHPRAIEEGVCHRFILGW